MNDRNGKNSNHYSICSLPGGMNSFSSAAYPDALCKTFASTVVKDWQINQGRLAGDDGTPGCFVEFFAGSCGMSTSFLKLGACVQSYDVLLRLSDEWTTKTIGSIKENLFQWIDNHCSASNKDANDYSNIMLFFGVPCRYWTKLSQSNGLTRRKEHVWGDHTVRQCDRSGNKSVRRRDEENANYQLMTMLHILDEAEKKYPKIQWCIENGKDTYLWQAMAQGNGQEYERGL